MKLSLASSLLDFANRRKVIFSLGSLLFVLAIFLSLKVSHFFSAQHAEETPRNVEVILVKQEPIRAVTRLIGTVRAKQEAIYSAKVNGHLKIHTPSGANVSKGTIIAEIDDTQLSKQYDILLEKARIAKIQYERLKTLETKNSASQATVEKKQIEWLEAEKQAVKGKQDIEKALLIASFDGFLGTYKFREGAYLKKDETIVSLYDPSGVIIEINISEGILETLSDSPNALIDDQILPLSHFKKVIDPETHMASALIELPEEYKSKYIIGTSIDVDLVVKEIPNAFVIPYEAVFIQNQKTYVYVVKENKAKRTLVKLGVRQKDKIEISEGLHENDQVIWRGQNRLYDGIDVEVYDPLKSQFKK
ncbi:MAG: efflux RND transporter periplasmic adaptor subunit [Alphaproteobacteria bacterium]|nr:efflux RND transporter periplasmic adaptor subunit [Alphaproteobacteria bacterium]